MAQAPLLETVHISEIPTVVAKDTSVVTGLNNGNNANFTAGSIADLVTKERLNIDKVANLAPSEMPVSDAVAAELRKKLDKDGSITIAQVTDLQAALDNKVGKNDSITIAKVTGLEERLDAVETGPVHVGRITDFTPAVEAVINTRTDLIPTVIKGPMDW